MRDNKIPRIPINVCTQWTAGRQTVSQYWQWENFNFIFQILIIANGSIEYISDLLHKSKRAHHSSATPRPRAVFCRIFQSMAEIYYKELKLSCSGSSLKYSISLVKFYFQGEWLVWIWNMTCLYISHTLHLSSYQRYMTNE